MNNYDVLDFSKRGNSLIGQEMFKILEKADELERTGEKVFHLELGDPKIDPPEEIIRETIKALEAKKVGYCPSGGVMKLREKIADYYSNEKQNLDFNQIAVSPANLLISQFLDIVCDRGDRVALFTPAFPTYLAACKQIGLEAQYVPLSEKNGFQLTIEDIDKAINGKPKALIVNSGNNPTGAIYSKDVLQYLVEKCREIGCWLLSDETYLKLSYQAENYSLINVEYPKLMIISSFSKIFSIPGFRVGFAIADPRLINKVILSSSTLYSCLPIFVQLGVCRGINLMDDYAKKMSTYYQSLASECTKKIRSSEKIACIEPSTGFYLFIDIRKTQLEGFDFARQLFEECKTAITPGEVFGYNGFVRASICGKTEDVIEGIRRLVHFSNAT
jgi:aspartate/methionine/tyrosine aminotransferase